MHHIDRSIRTIQTIGQHVNDWWCSVDPVMHFGVTMTLPRAYHEGDANVPADAYAVMAVTMHDLFLDHDDVYTVGLAGCGVGVFSFYRCGGVGVAV